MRVEHGTLSLEERSSEARRDDVYFKSRLGCFNSFNGIQRGELTTLTAPKGMGKSTFVKTVITEALCSNRTVLTILSEERTDAYKKPIAECIESVIKDDAECSVTLENSYYASMMDWDRDQKNLDYFLESLENAINTYQIDLVVFDNITTSFIEQMPIGKQGAAIDALRSMAYHYDIGLMCVFHTAKGTNIYNRLIDGEDVRGNAVSINAGSYNLVLTTFFRTNPPRSFIHIDKARYHAKANKTYWELGYSKKYGLFLKDRQSSAAIVEGIINTVKKNAVKREVNLNVNGWGEHGQA